MAIVQFNSSSKPWRGKVGGLVFKHYADKVVVTHAPTFTGEWSTAQQAGRKRFALASAHARTVCADPVLRAKYAKIAMKRGLTVRSLAISAYLRGKTAEIEGLKSPVRRPSGQARRPRRTPPRKSDCKAKTPLREVARVSSEVPVRPSRILRRQDFVTMRAPVSILQI